MHFGSFSEEFQTNPHSQHGGVRKVVLVVVSVLLLQNHARELQSQCYFGCAVLWCNSPLDGHSNIESFDHVLDLLEQTIG